MMLSEPTKALNQNRKTVRMGVGRGDH